MTLNAYPPAVQQAPAHAGGFIGGARRLAARPRVLVHVAVSLDGATTGFEPDVDRFYGLIGTWEEDATLVGADTILAQEQALAAAPRPGPARDAPLLAVVDGRRRVTAWEALRDCGHWSGVVALRTESAGSERDGVPELAAGHERVDLGAALSMLHKEGVRSVRVDSGGGLIGALLAAGLVDELSLLVHPVLAGRGERRWHGGTRGADQSVERLGVEALGDGLVWMRYAVGERAKGDRGPAGLEARPAAIGAVLSRR